MGRKSVPVNPVRGERLKELLEKHGVSQEELAERIGYSKEHISYIVNGKRNLTADAAEAIANIFKTVSVEWLLGFSPYMNAAEHFVKALDDMDREASTLFTGFSAFATLAGYSISTENISGKGTISEYFSSTKEYCKISKGEKQVCLSLEEMNRFENEVYDFVELKIKHLFAQKGAGGNGKSAGTPR